MKKKLTARCEKPPRRHAYSTLHNSPSRCHTRRHWMAGVMITNHITLKIPDGIFTP